MDAGLVFGERLKRARNSKGLSQRQVAEEFGMTKVGYQNYEYGRNTPTFSMLSRIADYFNVSLDYLFGRSDEPRLPDKETLAIAREYQAKVNAQVQARLAEQSAEGATAQ